MLLPAGIQLKGQKRIVAFCLKPWNDALKDALTKRVLGLMLITDLVSSRVCELLAEFDLELITEAKRQGIHHLQTWSVYISRVIEFTIVVAVFDGNDIVIINHL